ncbi:CU044_5270 family protein [Actinocorallia sp. B10E7]|uniref:CU044_5270 family protein n=1 Tax=Actinocorallia sp. B10E7 TaxID=3153558 RepID=UPI00325D6E66
MPDDLLQALAATRPDLDPAPDQARRDRDLARALASPATAHPARRRGRSRWKVLGLGVVAAGTVVAVVATTGTTPPTPQSRPSGTEAAPAPLSAREILLAAGASSLKAPANEGDFLYTHWISGRQLSIPGKDYLLDSRMEQEMWRAKEPGHYQYMINRRLGTTLASPADEEAWKADGSPRSWTFEVPPLMSPSGGMIKSMDPVRIKLEPAATAPDVWRHVSDFGVGRIGSRLATPENLAELPTDPKALYDRLLHELTAMADAAPKEHQADLAEHRYLFSWEIFRWGVDLIARFPVSPALRSAAFGMLSYIPGVESRGETTDPLGRKGQAIALTDQTDSGSVQNGKLIKEGTLFDTVLIIDPSTGTALATVDQISKPVWPPSDKQGQWRSYEIFKESRWIPALPMSRLKNAEHSR